MQVRMVGMAVGIILAAPSLSACRAGRAVGEGAASAERQAASQLGLLVKTWLGKQDAEAVAAKALCKALGYAIGKYDPRQDHWVSIITDNVPSKERNNLAVKFAVNSLATKMTTITYYRGVYQECK